jgi:hypothetical protein
MFNWTPYESTWDVKVNLENCALELDTVGKIRQKEKWVFFKKNLKFKQIDTIYHCNEWRELG